MGRIKSSENLIARLFRKAGSIGLVKTILLVLVVYVLGVLSSPAIQKLIHYYDLTEYRGIKDYHQLTVPEGGLANFALIDSDGEGHELYRYSNAKGIVIISQGNDCPVIQKYTPILRALKIEFESRGIRFLMLNVNAHDTREAISKEAFNYQVTLPILLDPGQVVTRELGFKRTSEAILIDPKTWRIIYRGAISDQMLYEGELPKARKAFLQQAIEDQLHGRKVATPESLALGCAITFEQRKEPQYAMDVAPIVASKCLFCHFNGSGGSKPYFENYESVRNWTAMIKDTVLTRRMPPWGYDSQPGQYKNDFSLTADQKRTLIDWINQGAHRGFGGDPLHRRAMGMAAKKQEAKDFKVAYTATTDHDIDVPPKGFTEYQYYQMGGPVPRDMWIDGINVVSTNPRTLHHMMLIITAKPLSFFQDRAKNHVDEQLQQESSSGTIPIWTLSEIYKNNIFTRQFSRFQIWALGKRQPSMINKLFPGAAFFIPKDSYLIIEAHYHGTGREEKERTTLEFSEYKSNKPPKELKASKLASVDFIEIPPFASEHKVVTEAMKIDNKSVLLLNSVHMHMRGKSMKVFATYPDLKRELLFSLPFFNYNTSTAISVFYKDNKVIPAGTKIHAECVYDNSESNPYNPDPTKLVQWGQTLDRSEMCLTNAWYYEVD